ncbi:hypothetical protein EDEG_02363 [Edhazardia aedis USNM 41457]|uniref:Uncharacterized protein n=1 Tax=Edhazardia aedis (strain USNM 41457) TaxID=1003232 RepID=J9DPL4_EDHAE|nr:hypothetical protein EDEG_02363 [Edhazardia aedis USNM 41457]|eukprot:EJW03297.1 hypothetical protein EDEG_02363 [Edhazardia aedis USNM 41457]
MKQTLLLLVLKILNCRYQLMGAFSQVHISKICHISGMKNIEVTKHNKRKIMAFMRDKLVTSVYVNNVYGNEGNFVFYISGVVLKYTEEITNNVICETIDSVNKDKVDKTVKCPFFASSSEMVVDLIGDEEYHHSSDYGTNLQFFFSCLKTK